MNELFKRMNIPDEALPEDKRAQIEKQQTFRRMQACLDAETKDETDRDRAEDVVERLRVERFGVALTAALGTSQEEILPRDRAATRALPVSKTW